MRISATAFALALLVSSSASAATVEEKFTDLSDFGHITCKSPSGDEIKEWKTYRTTGDRFFKDGTISVNVHSGWAPKSNTCRLDSVSKKMIKVALETGTVVEIPVIESFTIFAGADCGTDIGRYLGKTAAIACSVSAISVKYTNQ
jgi:hypothetical protein